MEMTGKEAFFVALLFAMVNCQPDTHSYSADGSFMLGCSLIESTDEISQSNSLGTSLVDFTDTSMQSLDSSVESHDAVSPLNLGSSLVMTDTETDSVSDASEISLELGLSLDVIEYQSDQDDDPTDQHVMFTSTPKKAMIADNYYHVHAKLKPPKALNEYIASELTHGGEMKKKALDLSSIQQCKRKECKCGKDCKRKISMRDIYQFREMYWIKSKSERFSWLISVIKDAEQSGKSRMLYLTREVVVCTEAFIDILRISRGAYFKAVKLNKDNRMTIHLNEPRKQSKQTIEAIVWFQEYSQFYGDRMPHKEDVLLPYKSRKQDIYQSYKNEHKDFVSRSQFYRIWSDHFPHVKKVRVYIDV
ncbi:uncharacterized protein LOC128548795 [Mercenaria mercenaria]|uniref:uncharacterized protein LOC128548795 n=1 Tax=Mercenaria mercenaria TaxID=6596 RepID=UPI00234EC931|nr:uncharacterized protein LOC128548795 [Mercenaria mercenaria]